MYSSFTGARTKFVPIYIRFFGGQHSSHFHTGNFTLHTFWSCPVEQVDKIVGSCHRRGTMMITAATVTYLLVVIEEGLLRSFFSSRVPGNVPSLDYAVSISVGYSFVHRPTSHAKNNNDHNTSP